MTTTARAHRAAESRGAERVGRAGWAARVVVYTVTAVLVSQVALHRADGSDRADQNGALNVVADRSFGKLLLVVLAIGLVCFAIGRAAEILNNDDDGAKRAAKIMSKVCSAVTQLGLAALAIGLVLDRSSSPSGEKEQGFTARVLGWPNGPLLVGIGGAVIVAVGVGFCVQAVRRRWMKRLEQHEMSQAERKWTEIVGVIGHAARGLAYGLIGLFVIRAARQYDPKEATGLDGALRRVADESWGPPLLLIVAAGFLAYAAYCFFMARFREFDG